MVWWDLISNIEGGTEWNEEWSRNECRKVKVISHDKAAKLAIN